MKTSTARLSGQALRATSIAGLVLFGASAMAATVWTNWTSATLGANGGGSAAGTVSGVGVTYAGELDASVTNGASNIWAPNSSFVGGTSTASPSTVGDDLRLNGSSTGVNTITFASAVVDPLIAIWSLGAPGASASFSFNATPTLQAGGPNSQFGGASITLNGNTVSGSEGNGVVQFTGTFTSLSWTNTFENFYAFTVGINGVGGPTPPPPTGAPEPGTLVLLGAGFAVIVISRRRGGTVAP